MENKGLVIICDYVMLKMCSVCWKKIKAKILSHKSRNLKDRLSLHPPTKPNKTKLKFAVQIS